jgi:hypothetical protein
MRTTAAALIAVIAAGAPGAAGGCRNPSGGDETTAALPERTWNDPPREQGPARATQISVGRTHACARMSDDSVRCWGANDWNMQDSERAGERAAGRHLDDVPDRRGRRRRDRTVWCWGANHQGQLGTPPSETERGPAAVPGIAGAVSLTAAEQGACALVEDGAIWCWGQELSPGRMPRVNEPVRVLGPSDALVVRGKFFFCALRGDGSVWCWGPNMGARPAPVAGLTDVTEVSVGAGMACARTSRGALSCWGDSDSGQLGPSSGEFERQPVPIAGLAGVTTVGAGSASACAASADGVRCWGHVGAHPAFSSACLRMTSHHGGGGAPLQWQFCPVPTRLDGLADVVALDVGGLQHCALTRDGRVFCWGPDDGDRPRPVVQVSL